jgi:hypothetical protein
MVHSLFRPFNPLKEVVEEYLRREEGQKAMRHARNELARLEQDRPKYVSPDGLLKLK